MATAAVSHADQTQVSGAPAQLVRPEGGGHLVAGVIQVLHHIGHDFEHRVRLRLHACLPRRQGPEPLAQFLQLASLLLGAAAVDAAADHQALVIAP